MLSFLFGIFLRSSLLLCVFVRFILLMLRRPPSATRPDTLCPYTTLFRSPAVPAGTVSITIRKPSSVTLTMEDFERGGLFRETKIATRQVSPLDVELRDRKSTRLNSSH